MPKRVCVKVSSLRPEYPNLKRWMQTPGNVLVTRNGRVMISEDGKRYVYAHKSSPWANPYKLANFSLEESLAMYDKHLDKLLQDPKMLREFLKLNKAKNIGCFCDPGNKCHGDIIIKKLKQYSKTKSHEGDGSDPDDDKKDLLHKIKAKFRYYEEKYGQPPTYTNADMKPKDMQESLRKFGIFYCKDPVSNDALDEAREAIIVEMSMHIFNTDDPMTNTDFASKYKEIKKLYPDVPKDKRILMTLSCWWKPEFGFGNSNFRFLYYQYMEKEDTPVFDIGDKPLYVERNPYHRHNLRLMESNPKLWKMLRASHKTGQVVLSWDSAKVRFYDSRVCKSTKPAMTPRHRDIYGDLDRTQAMILDQEPGSVLLGFVIFSHHRSIQKLIAQYLDMEPKGFSKGLEQHPELAEILDKYWRAPRKGFVIWNQGTFHYEGVPTDTTKRLKRLKTVSGDSESLRHLSIRWVIGTHVVHKIDKQDLRKLAILSEAGYQPLIYNSQWNKGHPVQKNVVNTKFTQWKHPRKPTKWELRELRRAKRNLKKDRLDLNKLELAMYGIE